MPVPRGFVLLAIAVGFGLRVRGLDELHLAGDSAYSVYAANREWLTVVTERLSDGHPPFYYYILKVWILIAGDGEGAVRFLSVLPGVLTIALTFRLGQLTLGERVGILGAWLIAVSPYLVAYSRAPRMYAWLAFAAVLLAVLGLVLANRPTPRRGLVYMAGCVATLYLHYFGVLVAVSIGLALVGKHLLSPRRRRTNWTWSELLQGPLLQRSFGLRPFVWWVAATAVAVLIWLPWALYAFVSSRDSTARIISDAPWPPNVAGLLNQLWLVAWVGELFPLDAAQVLVSSLTVLLGLATAVALIKVPGRLVLRSGHTRGGFVFLLSLVAVPLVISVILFQEYPYFIRPRVLIFLLPPLALLFSALMLASWRAWRPMGALVTGAPFLLMPVVLAWTFAAEPLALEPESVLTARYLGKYGRPSDAALFHAFWQQGYVSAHLGGEAPSMYPLRETPVEALPGLFAQHGRVWLIMFGAEPHDPDYPAEDWLDRSAYRVFSRSFGLARMSLYTPGAGPIERVGVGFGQEMSLDTVIAPDRSVEPGDPFRLQLAWRARERPAADYTTSLDLVGPGGRVRFGVDTDLVSGRARSSRWASGTVVEQRVGMLVPSYAVPGDYEIQLAIFEGSDRHRLRVDNRMDMDYWTLGSVTVRPSIRSQSAIDLMAFKEPGQSQAILTPTGVNTLTALRRPLEEGVDPVAVDQARRILNHAHPSWGVAPDSAIVEHVRTNPSLFMGDPIGTAIRGPSAPKSVESALDGLRERRSRRWPANAPARAVADSS